MGTWHRAVAGEEASVGSRPAGEHGCAATASIGRSPSKRWRYANPSQRGRPSLGAKAPPRRSPRALLCLRVRPAHRDEKLTEPRPEEWLLIEWPEGEKEPTKYWLSTLPENIEFAVLVDIAKLRWRIERDYQELKQEVGLGHFEGRGWRGFHHHATMCIATYGFLVSERETIPPSGSRPARLFEELAVPAGYRPRGAAAANRAPHSKFDRHHAPTPDHRPRQAPGAMPVLSKSNASTVAAEKFVTQ